MTKRTIERVFVSLQKKGKLGVWVLSYRKPRRISHDVKKQRRDQMKNINKSQLLLNIGRKENIIGSRDFLT